MRKFIKTPTLLLFLIIVISLSVRFLFIDKIPVGIGHDEIDFIINSKSVFLRFSDLTGTWSPLSFKTVPFEQPKSELLYLLLAPAIGPFPFSLILAKAPFIIVNVGLIVVLYLITKKLAGRKEALFVGLVASFNPWFFYFSRTSFEAPVAVFFYFLSLYLLLILRGWKILLVFVPLLLAFSSYMGTKLIFIPFCLISFIFVWFNTYKKRFTAQLLVLFLTCLALFIYFVVSMSNQPAGDRINELSTPFTSGISQIVDLDRKQSISTSIQNLFSNKFSVYLDQFIKNYYNSFSTQFLFVDNTGYMNLTLYKHGYFYYIDLIFILAGGYYLFIKKRYIFYLMLCLMLIAPLPAVISTLEPSFTLRAALLFPVLIIFSGVGFYTVWTGMGKFIAQRLIRMILIAIYTLSIINFMYIYFLMMPITNSEGFFFSSRQISKYLTIAGQNEQKIIVTTPEPRDLFKEYMFYSNIYSRENTELFEKIFTKQVYTYQNISIVPCDGLNEIDKKALYITSADLKCSKTDSKLRTFFKKSITLAQLKDSGSVFNIYNDRICSKYPLPPYVSGLNFSDLAVEPLAEKVFCTKYFVRYKK